jgi:hypothetical protein
VNEKSACVATSPLDALIVTNFTIVGNSEVEPAHQEVSTDGLPVIREVPPGFRAQSHESDRTSLKVRIMKC